MRADITPKDTIGCFLILILLVILHWLFTAPFFDVTYEEYDDNSYYIKRCWNDTCHEKSGYY